MATFGPRSFASLFALVLCNINSSHAASLQQRALGPPPSEFENGWAYQGCYMYDDDISTAAVAIIYGILTWPQ
jgi:hypothetical protein